MGVKDAYVKVSRSIDVRLRLKTFSLEAKRQGYLGDWEVFAVFDSSVMPELRLIRLARELIGPPIYGKEMFPWSDALLDAVSGIPEAQQKIYTYERAGKEPIFDSTPKLCPCGLYSVLLAAVRGHKCGPPTKPRPFAEPTIYNYTRRRAIQRLRNRIRQDGYGICSFATHKGPVVLPLNEMAVSNICIYCNRQRTADSRLAFQKIKAKEVEITGDPARLRKANLS